MPNEQATPPAPVDRRVEVREGRVLPGGIGAAAHAGSPPDMAPERACLVGELRLALREYLGVVDSFDGAVAACLGVGRTDLTCFDLLERRGVMSAGELATACGLSTGAMTFALDRLEQAGMVRRRRDTEDRRRVLVELVPAAHRRAFKLHEPLVMELRALVARYSNRDIEVITDFLRAARAIYDEHVPALRRRSAARRRP
jgi:DNA-binding MarR family transcriptional regulator